MLIIFALHKGGRLGQKVSDEFTVPLCRGHHREVHRVRSGGHEQPSRVRSDAQPNSADKQGANGR